ncbi:MAG TPA: glycosyltransferase [Flavisolibacter sp.]|nr:glycosyltransferase [Flavisolibacter sp.]
MKRMIKVSVIIPVFNSAHLIEKTIQSILKQQFQDWEMIIVDDGSMDNIGEVIGSFIKKNERIKFYQQQNAGASAARNTGIKNAKNEWLLFLDADDWIREDYFEKMVAVLINDPTIDVVHCGWTRVSKSGAAGKGNFGGEQSDMFPSLAHYCPFAIHSCIVRKGIVERVGGFDTSFKTCGDWDLWQRVARTGAKFRMVKETMAFYQTTSNSLSSDGNQFCINGLQVISNAYSSDARVPHPKQHYEKGLITGHLRERKYYFVTWSAGLLIGSSKPASHLLGHLKGIKAENLDPDIVAETVLDSVIIPAEKEQPGWIAHWNRIEKNLRIFLKDLQEQSHSQNLADKVCALIERYVITQNANEIEQVRIGKSLAEKIDIEGVIIDKNSTGEIEHYFGIVECKKKIPGIIELDVKENIVSSRQIKDAIATKFSWMILQDFFSQTVYPFIKPDKRLAKQNLSEQEIHDKTGWKIFLQQLWQKPDWDEGMFYDPFASKEKGVVITTGNNEVHVEISQDLPRIKTDASDLNVIYYIGGIKAGIASVSVHKNYISPQQLRAAINTNGGYELCRITVRETLIGNGKWSDLNLRDQLRKNLHNPLES